MDGGILMFINKLLFWSNRATISYKYCICNIITKLPLVV